MSNFYIGAFPQKIAFNSIVIQQNIEILFFLFETEE
jgi:hypothetical protein